MSEIEIDNPQDGRIEEARAGGQLASKAVAKAIRASRTGAAMKKYEMGGPCSAVENCYMEPSPRGEYYLASDVDLAFSKLAAALSKCAEEFGKLSRETGRYSEASATAMIELGEVLKTFVEQP